MHLVGCPRGFVKAKVHLGDQAKVPILSQVLLLVVGVSAGERDIVLVIPEEPINIKSSFICASCINGIDLREGNYRGKSYL